MIERYTRPEMAVLWSDGARFGRYVEIELLATEAQAALGVVPSDAAAACRANAPKADVEFVEAVTAREQVTGHDVAAFVDVMQQRIGQPHGTWIHHGLTSSDVVDTALSWAMRDAVDVIAPALDGLIATIIRVARAHRDTPVVGRTHGIHAEPTTFGAKVALWALQFDRDRRRLARARESVAVCKLSGAVGTYSNISPAVEVAVGRALDLVPVPATQVIARDRHAELLYACASIAATCELVAVELRHQQRTELSEVREGFGPEQKGSSAMPHKRNPISAETLSGLARVVRSNLLAGLQDVALWHERDISHSSVERIVLPDSTALAHYMVVRLERLIDGLEIDTERMAENLRSSHGVVFSQPVLLAMVEAGVSRDAAYRVVQGAATTAWNERRPFREVLEGEGGVGLGAAALDRAFDLDRALEHAGRTVDALGAIDGLAGLDGLDHHG